MSLHEVQQETENYIAQLKKRLSNLETSHHKKEELLQIDIAQHQNENSVLLAQNKQLHSQLTEFKAKLSQSHHDLKHTKHRMNYHRKQAEDVDHKNARLEARNKQLEHDLLNLRALLNEQRAEHKSVLNRSIELEQKSSHQTQEIANLLHENMRDHNDNSHIVQDLQCKLDDALNQILHYKHLLTEKDMIIRDQKEEFRDLSSQVQNLRQVLMGINGV